MPELKPCPFCGGEAKLHSSFEIHPIIDQNGAYVDADINEDGMSWVYCTHCHASTAEVDVENEKEAIDDWNRRTNNATD